MLIRTPDPSQVPLEIYAQNPDGTEKTDIATASVRVYHMVGPTETEVLSPSALGQVGSTSVFRYLWAPTSLAAGQYTIEYTLTDDEGLVSVIPESLVVEDFAQQSTLVLVQADAEFIRQIEQGRWKIIGNQMIFYEDDNATPLITFNLKDSTGAPTMDDVFERIEAP